MFGAGLVVAGLLLITPNLAIAHPGHDHNGDHDHGIPYESMTYEQRTMVSLIVLLEQLIDLLEQQAALTAGHTLESDPKSADGHDTEHQNKHDEGALHIVVIEQGGELTVHVHDPDVIEMDFALEDLAIIEEDAIIAAIAAETELDVETISDVIRFQSMAETDTPDHTEEGAENPDA